MTNGEKNGYKQKPNYTHDNRISLIAETKDCPQKVRQSFVSPF